jgi:hypothetical protein
MPSHRDDRVLKQTRVLGAFIVPVSARRVCAAVLLPASTKDSFAWEIHPDMTPMIMRAGYIAGA